MTMLLLLLPNCNYLLFRRWISNLLPFLRVFCGNGRRERGRENYGWVTWEGITMVKTAPFRHQNFPCGEKACKVDDDAFNKANNPYEHKSMQPVSKN